MHSRLPPDKCLPKEVQSSHICALATAESPTSKCCEHTLGPPSSPTCIIQAERRVLVCVHLESFPSFLATLPPVLAHAHAVHAHVPVPAPAQHVHSWSSSQGTSSSDAGHQTVSNRSLLIHPPKNARMDSLRYRTCSQTATSRSWRRSKAWVPRSESQVRRKPCARTFGRWEATWTSWPSPSPG